MDLFGVGILELLVVLVVAMLVLGPEQLPQVANKLGGMLHKARQSVAETRDAFLVDMKLDGQPLDDKAAPTQLGHKPVDRRSLP